MGGNGFFGKLLRVDLSTGKSVVEEISDKVQRKFLGGNGFGIKYLYEETGPETDPLGPENLLIFSVGPLTGTGFYNTDRFQVITKSPATGIYMGASCGGFWASKFKKCGYDAMVITGKADKPVYLSLTDSSVEIKDATHLWGKDTFESNDLLKEAEGKTARAAVIGPAGENLVKIACIISDGRHGRAAGRGGVGAVMGSKNLKAVVVNGKQQVGLADKEEFRALSKSMAAEMKTGPEGLRIGGTGGGVDGSEAIGNLPIQNWKGASFTEGAAKITGMVMVKDELIDRYNCGACQIKCGRVVEAKGGTYDGLDIAGPEYETLGLMGANLMIDNLRTILKENEMCNYLGLDTISAGNVLGFAMECWEHGLITEKDTGGIDMSWGNGEGACAMLEKIAYRKDFGDSLAEGVRTASRRLGGIAPDFALEVKGLEPPAHDPRSKQTISLGYCTSNRGACHLAAFSHDFEEGAIFVDSEVPDMTDRFNKEGKALAVKRFQEIMAVYDAAVICKFAVFGGVSIQPIVKALNLACGWDIDSKELFSIGERIHNLTRMYNNRMGITRKDDRLPARFDVQVKNPETTKLPPTYELLSEYYDLRKWNEFGIPTMEIVKELNLEEYVKYGLEGLIA